MKASAKDPFNFGEDPDQGNEHFFKNWIFLTQRICQIFLPVQPFRENKNFDNLNRAENLRMGYP